MTMAHTPLFYLLNVLSYFLFPALLLACNTSDGKEKVFFNNEKEYNNINSFFTNDGKIYVGGFRYQSQVEGKPIYTMLCLDPELNTIWERNFGSHENGERFHAACIDNNGNIYLAGCSGFMKENPAGLILKINPEGAIVWQQEFTTCESFQNVQFHDNSLIIAAAVPNESGLPLYKSCTIMKLNTDGHIQWVKTVSKGIGSHFLDIYNNKIIVSHFAGMIRTNYADSRISSLNQENGNIEWQLDLTGENTGIDKGVYLMGQFVKNDSIYVMCRSQNPLVGQYKVFTIGMDGNIGNEVPESSSDPAKEDREFFIQSDYRVNRFRNDPIAVRVYCKPENHIHVNYPSVETDISHVGCIYLKDTKYTFTNIINDEEHLSHWRITKSE